MSKIRIIPETIQLIRMTDAEYFSPKFKEYISNSKLGLLNEKEGGSLEKFLSGFKQSYSDSFALGSAVHASILQPDSYIISPLRKPSGKLGVFAEKVFELRGKGMNLSDAIEKASIDSDYYAGKLTGTRLKTAIKSSLPFYLQRIHVDTNIEDVETLFLSPAIAEKHDKCVTNLLNNKSITKVLKPESLFTPVDSYNEYAILADIEVIIDDKPIIVKMKAKLDNFNVDHENETATLNDLKTSGKPVSFFMGNDVVMKNEAGEVTGTQWFDGSFQHFHYFRQMGTYLWLMVCYLQTKGYKYKPKANMVVVETIPEFRSKVYPVNSKQLKAGLDEFKELITIVAKWKMENQ